MKEVDVSIHKKFMQVALGQAEEALRQGEFPVGAIFVYENQVVASGRRENSQEQSDVVNEIDHAEILALRDFLAQKTDIPMGKITVYSTMEPCLMCYSTMILNGIRNMVYAYEDVMGGGSNLPLQQLRPLYQEMDIVVTANVLREQSVAFFKQFFSNPDNMYWKDSLLATYTLEQ